MLSHHRIYIFTSTISVLLMAITSCKEANRPSNQLPLPTDHTTIKMDMEDGDKKTERQLYFDMVHGGKEVNWKEIEIQNAFDLLETKRALKSINVERSEEEWVANGKIKGKWIERGGLNQAGNITTTAYDVEHDEIYAIGGGGPMFKGGRFGQPWELVNDDLRFSSRFLEIVENEEGDLRILAAIGHIPYYSDDEGKTWIKSTGIEANGGDILKQITLPNNDVLILHKYDYWSDIVLYKSENHGAHFKRLKTFNTSDRNNISMTKSAGNDQILLVEQVAENRSYLFEYNFEDQKLDILNTQVSKAFGSDGRANINAINTDSLVIYLYEENQNLYSSVDTGKTWTFVSQLPTNPWDVSLFMAPSDPTKFIYGEVNSYRSQNGGANWVKINEWWEYYQNVEYKLHADIMSIDEYYTADGTPFILIGNHGGLSISENYGTTNRNIGMIGLNVGQFYDVKSYPPNTNRFFGGTQDQGLQKGQTRGDVPDNFIQIISGDYGHLQFTGPEREHLWTVYPGGSISFYEKPLSQTSPNLGYEINSRNETVWIPPIMPSEDPSKDIVYAAGGSINSESEGSHILKLEVQNNQIFASELPFDFSISGGNISAMAISPANTNTWWVATTNGYVYKSIDNGLSFELSTKLGAGAHYLYGSCLLPSKTNENTIYLSGNGYNTTSPVYRSTDGGTTWDLLRLGMPKTTAFKLALNEDESLLYAATEAGPYIWLDDEGSWYSLVGESTPNQTFWSVEYIEESKTARFSTYGRGVWDFEFISSDPTSNTTIDKDDDIAIYPNPCMNYMYIEVENADQFTFEIINSQGKLMNGVTIDKSSQRMLRVRTEMLSSGTYYVKASNGSKVISKAFTKI